MTDILLVATDLDGTLIGNGEQPRDYRAFRDFLRRFRVDWHTRWAIVTGRHADSVRSGLAELTMHGLVPDFLVLEDSRIYRRNAKGNFSPFRWWNFRVNRKRKALQRG